jgi:hypothetical protein
MKERLHTSARRWLESGRDASLLLTGKEFFAAQCWLNANPIDSPESAAAHHNMDDFVRACKAGIGGEAGWNALLWEKTFCSGCGMSYHLENIGICTGCMQYVCGGCGSKHQNCGGEVVG